MEILLEPCSLSSVPPELVLLLFGRSLAHLGWLGSEVLEEAREDG
jgi:hypothetical protein